MAQAQLQDVSDPMAMDTTTESSSVLDESFNDSKQNNPIKDVSYAEENSSAIEHSKQVNKPFDDVFNDVLERMEDNTFDSSEYIKVNKLDNQKPIQSRRQSKETKGPERETLKTSKTSTPNHNKSKSIANAQIEFDPNDEETLMNHVQILIKLGFGCTRTQLVGFVEEFCNHLGTSEKNYVIEQWIPKLMSSYPHVMFTTGGKRGPTGTNQSPIGSVIEAYYEELAKVIEEYEIGKNPSCIFALDETNLTPVGDPFRTGEGSEITVLGCANAAGDHLPPFIVFPKMKADSTLLEKASPGTQAAVTSSGASDVAIFKNYLQIHFFRFGRKVSKCEDKILLLYDANMYSLSLNVIQMAKSKNVILFPLPSYMTHVFSFHELVSFGPLRRTFYDEMNRFLGTNGIEEPSGKNVVEIVCKAHLASFDPNNVKLTFSNNAFHPFTRDLFHAKYKRIQLTSKKRKRVSDVAAVPAVAENPYKRRHVVRKAATDSSASESEAKKTKEEATKSKDNVSEPEDDVTKPEMDVKNSKIGTIVEKKKITDEIKKQNNNVKDDSALLSMLKTDIPAEINYDDFKKSLPKQTLREQNFTTTQVVHVGNKKPKISNPFNALMDNDTVEVNSTDKIPKDDKPKDIKADLMKNIANGFDLNVSLGSVDSESGASDEEEEVVAKGDAKVSDEDEEEVVEDDANVLVEGDDAEKCCVCGLYDPEELEKDDNSVLQWAQCDKGKCGHWTHLAFCTPVYETKPGKKFLCPCCE